MTKIAYITKNFATKTLDRIEIANQIIQEYSNQGFDLTVRQLYYQLVSRGYIPNTRPEYKKLVKTLTDARLAGMISWHAIIDRTRILIGNSHWDQPSDVIRSAEASFQIDKWDGQPYRVEVWIEKDALRGVISGVCRELDISQFACRGYISQSELWRSARRMKRSQNDGQIPYIIHLGDHDPSGIDMTRDISDRLELFELGTEGIDFHVKRIALNFDQVQQYDPPPNFAKEKDSRTEAYSSEYGHDSWELDALEPSVIVNLIREHVGIIRDDKKWQELVEKERRYKQQLTQIRTRYDDIVNFLEGEV